jgi:hypothetical protein
MRPTGKPFIIEKKQVYEAYEAVKSKGGAAGEDGQTIEQFEADLKNNLYKIWNRMSSGSYFPPPVRAVSIPKKSGGQRILGVPIVADRVAQMVVKQVIESDLLDPVFLSDSYGYRLGTENHAVDDPGIEHPTSNRVVHGRHRPTDQSAPTGLDSILRTIRAIGSLPPLSDTSI